MKALKKSEFTRAIYDWVVAHGGRPDSRYKDSYLLLPTVCGDLSVRANVPENRGALASVFCRFENHRAAQEYSAHKLIPGLGAYSSKWNFHKRGVKDLYDWFTSEVSKLLPPVPAPAPSPEPEKGTLADRVTGFEDHDQDALRDTMLETALRVAGDDDAGSVDMQDTADLANAVLEYFKREGKR